MASLIVITLGNLPGYIQNPLDRQYKKALFALMEEEGFQTEEEALAFDLDLAVIKKQITTVEQWEYELRQANANPIPVGKEKSKDLVKKSGELKKLKKNIQQQLENIISGKALSTAQI